MVVYIFDTNALSLILRYYYPGIFPKFWKKFNGDISHGAITSVRHVQREINNWDNKRIDRSWIKKNKHIFTRPTKADEKYVAELLACDDGSGLRISKKGKPRDDFFLADPWLIAKAYAIKGTVVTEETREPEFTKLIGSYSKIPDVCDNREIPCINLEKFMSEKKWVF